MTGKVNATKPDDLNVIPGPHLMEGENQLRIVGLSPPYFHHTHTLTYIQTHVINKYSNNFYKKPLTIHLKW